LIPERAVSALRCRRDLLTAERRRRRIVSQLTKAAPRLRGAIQRYSAKHNELDEHAGKLLRRLANNPESAKAFERLKPKDGSEAAGWEAAIIRACIETENLARTFADRVNKAKEKLKRRRRERLRKAAVTLRGFLNEIIGEQQKPPDSLWIRPKAAEDIAAMGHGLAAFDRWIDYVEKTVAELNLFRLRASRKSKPSSKTLSAGQIAAIGRLADEVKHVTGKPHYGGDC
jgi:hypothetical protein